MNRRLVLASLVAVAAGAWISFYGVGGTAWNGGKNNLTAASSGTAKVFIEQAIYDFGTMDVGETQRHKFVVKNEGTASLILKMQSTTCKCTLAELKDAVVPPGQSTQVELEWTGEHRQENYRHGARLSTNDPDAKSIDLVVEGRVRTKIGVWPEIVHFGDIDRNQEHRIDQLAIYSQTYPKLKIKSIVTTHPDAQVAPAYAPQELNLPAKSEFSRRLTLRFRAGAKPGPFAGLVQVVYETPAIDGRAAMERTFEFPFTGTVVGDVSLHGRDVVGRAVMLGTVTQDAGKKHTVYVHVRNGIGEGLDLSLGKVQPEFMQVRLGKRQRLSEKLSRFPIELEIPPGSPEINMTNVKPGEVQLCTTHPDYPAIRFDVSVAVIR